MAVKRKLKRTPTVRVDKDHGKLVQKSAHIEIRLKVITSVGDGDRERTFDEWKDVIFAAIKEAAGTTEVDSRVSYAGGYYIIDGRVCLPEDYDPETRDFKSGAHPPLWASTEEERKQWQVLERIEKQRDRSALARQPSNLLTSSEVASKTATAPPRRTVAPRTSAPQHYDWDAKDIGSTDVAKDAVKKLTEQLNQKVAAPKKKVPPAARKKAQRGQ